MSEPVDPPSTPGPLQFDRAEIPGGAAEREVPACRFCQTPLYSYYFDINGQMACEACRYKVEEHLKTGPGVAGFLRACVAGFGAALAGSGIYYGVRAVTGYEIGLISIAVGLMVGAAVRWGARHHGGWVYQSLAVFLTYMAIVSTYIPLMLQEFAQQEKGKQEAAAGATAQQAAQPGGPAEKAAAKPTPTFGDAAVGVIVVFAVAAALPFLAGFKNILGLVIIAFGLWEAWKINKRPVLAIDGPLTLGAAPPAPAAEG